MSYYRPIVIVSCGGTRLDKYQVLIVDAIGYVKKTDTETQVLFVNSSRIVMRVGD